MIKSVFRVSVVALSFVGAALFSNQVSASACKGLKDQACTSAKACSWVEGYERKDGRQVQSFCRTKAVMKKKTTLTSNAESKVKAK